MAAGFDGVGICAATPALGIEHYRAWLEAGMQGTMDYLRRHLLSKEDPRELLPSVRSVVAVSLSYAQPNPLRAGHPRIARYALGRDYHKVLRSKLRKVSAWIQARYPGAECRACVDSAPILEREYAHLAGLGWFGKNTMLIDSRKGSWFFLGMLLTSVSFEPDAPSKGSCGKCRACIDACPTGAIVQCDGKWSVDSRRCISYLTIEHRGAMDRELEARIGGWTFGCDVCQDVCPFNSPRESQPDRAVQTAEPDFLKSRAWPDLKGLSEIPREDWDALTRGSAVRRAGWEGLRRNASVNLRNGEG